MLLGLAVVALGAVVGGVVVFQKVAGGERYTLCTTKCFKEGLPTTGECEELRGAAQEEAQRVAPRYRTQKQCEYTFGEGTCDALTTAAGEVFFIPRMAAFLVNRDSREESVEVQPFFSSTSKYAAFRYYLVDAHAWQLADCKVTSLKLTKQQAANVLAPATPFGEVTHPKDTTQRDSFSIAHGERNAL